MYFRSRAPWRCARPEVLRSCRRGAWRRPSGWRRRWAPWCCLFRRRPTPEGSEPLVAFGGRGRGRRAAMSTAHAAGGRRGRGDGRRPGQRFGCGHGGRRGGSSCDGRGLRRALGGNADAATLPRGRTRRGAVIVASGLPGSPEARAAASAFSGLRDQPAAASLGLRERKGADAVRFMARLDTLPVVPRRGTDGWIRGSGGQ